MLTNLINKCSNILNIKRTRFQEKSLTCGVDLKGVRAFVTTVIRGSKNHELTGFLFELDWQNNGIKERIPIPLDTGHPFWNARGGNRGGRGVFIYNGTLYIATAMSVLMFDSKLKKIGELTHPYLAGLHEIYVDSEGIWLTSTVHDLVVKLDFSGNIIDEWWGSESQILQHEFGFSSRKLNLNLDFEKEAFTFEYERYCEDERLHANTVWLHNDEVYVLACRRKAFVRIRPNPDHIVLQDKQLRSPHNGIVTPDGRIIINDTQNQCIRTYDLQSGKRLMSMSTAIYRSKNSEQFAKAGWQRGLAHIKDSIFLVGTSPATIFEVDIDRLTIGQICKIDTTVSHCVHGLAVSRDF